MSLLEHQDEESIILKNDVVKIKFNKKGYATELLYKNKNVLTNLTGEPHDPDRYRSFYCDYHMNGKTCHMVISQVKIIQDNDQLIHIAFIDSTSSLGIEYHFILKNHDSAIYSYIISWNNTKHPLKVNELRTVYRFNQVLFNWSTNGVRFGRQPSSKEMLTGKKLQDETYRMKRGALFSNSQIYSKYDYAGYYKDTDFWGQAGDNFGAWLITPDKSFYGSGPLNQDLMIHYDGLILNYLFSEHFGKGLNILPTDFKKMYGPWCLYLNNGSFEDVVKRSKKEKQAWPYSWLDDLDYPLELSTVIGQISSAVSKKYKIILISNPKDKKTFIERQNSNTYYVETDENGKFSFKKIRPDSYSLYAYALDGTDLDEHLLIKDILLNQRKLDLGEFEIRPSTKPVWQIGYSSHTTAGFKFSDQLRNYIWQTLVPKNLTYHIGQNDDWYYLQNDQGKWQIKFKIEKKLLKEKLYLRIALAGATQKRMDQGDRVLIKVNLNGNMIFSKKLENDRSAYRSALKSGRYHLISIPISAQQLKLNKINTVSLTTDGYLMYDAIQLGEECKEDE
ncbi:polysaccharide lyase family protein [Lactobacillus paragasseri]|uniref:Polysaccharide lyase family protein n=1 Tax=Lactobacillus paragasseri TaxID=2107999 RepID=A0ABD4ZZV1_9LACO|nr:polysaccharide lyase family protein [Lactobacillus paragasseri]MDO6361086.1 polysaccharide lyase family protein [Lactobacillus paragasseri]MDX5058947.1 polysaccharide lyase family protein [Lactobacillus paragasseri]